MRIRRTATGLVINDSPGLSWILGGLFVVVGGVFFLGPLGLFKNSHKLSFILGAIVSLLGAVGICTGLWVWKRSPCSRVQAKISEQCLVVTRWGLAGRDELRVPFGDVEEFEIETGVDSDGDAVFRPLLRRRDRTRVLLSMLHVHDRIQMEQMIQELKCVVDALSGSPGGSLPPGDG